MKYFRYGSAALGMTLVVVLASCDKLADLTDKAKGLLGGDESSDAKVVGVEKVDEEQGKGIISTESRMVIVEFYTDT
jgi:hypothetical protein